MQDSLEDYIKLVRNTREDEPIKLSNDVQVTAKIKTECDKRAMKIVEFSIEGKLRPEIFVRCLPFINQEHYQDIVEERSITKLCGYSLCGKKIPEMPKKQYYISTKSNRVYDITDRKNYCSNFCYKASVHIKTQIDNSPLWLRKPEDVPNYKLLHASEGGLPGEFIDQGISKPVAEPAFTTISSFTEASLEDMVEREITTQKPNKSPTAYRKCSKLLKSTMQTISENNEQVEEDVELEPPKKIPEKTIKAVKIESTKHVVKKLPVIDENEEKIETKENIEETKDDPKSSSKKMKKKPKIDLEMQLEKALFEWLSLESYIFIYGEQKIREILDEKKLSNMFETLQIPNLDQKQQIKYREICRKLQLQEMADEKFDNVVVGNTKLKPLPDYKKLKDESKDLELKVRAFYSSTLYEKEDTNFPRSKKEQPSDNPEAGPPAVLPLIDVSSQNALRRKIFLNSINKAMQQLIQTLHITSYSALLSDLQALVRTFRLKADNIVFKPMIWNYISIFILNILSIRDKDIEEILQEKKSQEYIEMTLNSLPSKSNFLMEIMNKIRNIDLFIENYITCTDL